MLQESLIDVAPTPILPRRERLDDRVAGVVKVAGRMLVGRRIATPDVAADQAETQMHPPCPGFQAVFATRGARRHWSDLVDVLATHGNPPLVKLTASLITAPDSAGPNC